MIRFGEPVSIVMQYCLLVLLVAIGCTTKTEVYESQQNKEFKNGQTIFVKRTDELTRSYGAVSGRIFNEEHKFRYQFTINPNEIVWNGLLGEVPKNILNCDNTTYLKTNREQVNTDSVTQAITVSAASGYYKNVDKRYFFKWFGEQYFVMIDSAEYQSKKINCQEENVPNM